MNKQRVPESKRSDQLKYYYRQKSKILGDRADSKSKILDGDIWGDRNFLEQWMAEKQLEKGVPLEEACEDAIAACDLIFKKQMIVLA
jgi:hypothetical protein